MGEAVAMQVELLQTRQQLVKTDSGAEGNATSAANLRMEAKERTASNTSGCKATSSCAYHRHWLPCYGAKGHNPYNPQQSCIEDVCWKMCNDGMSWHQANCIIKKWHAHALHGNCSCLIC